MMNYEVTCAKIYLNKSTITVVAAKIDNLFNL